MKQTRYIIISLAFLFWQCRKEKDPIVKPVEIKQIDVLDFSVPGIDPKNISVGENLIVVYLPENYSKGDYIKPDIVLAAGYSSQSPLMHGVSFEGQQIRLELESTIGERKTFNVIVVPFKAIEPISTPLDLEFILGPEKTLTALFERKGTQATVNDSGKIVYNPFIRLTDQVTGQIAQELYAAENYANSVTELTVELPPSMLPGTYTAEIVWGTKTQLLSRQVTVKPGVLQFKRGSWHMLAGHRNFEVTAFNLSPTEKYEAIVQNDFIVPQRIPLKYEKPGTLSGSLPLAIGLGNYKITYLLDGKEQKLYEERGWLDRYSGDDNFYIQKNKTQPIVRIVTQPSLRSFFATPFITDMAYFPATNEMNRQEPILAYTQSWGATPNENKMILVNQTSGVAYTLPYSGTIYPIFDGFLTFLSYPIPDKVPNGPYVLSIVRGIEQTESYSQIVTLK